MRFATLDEWLAWQETLHPKSIDLGLRRVRQVALAMQLQQPQPFTLTVAGTNGKGSTVALLDAMLRAAGYRVGAYTSPHLLRYNERVRVNGVCAEDAALCESFQRIDEARGDISLSFFEFGTLAALDWFAQSELDVQILEVGLGGRLDAVNLIHPDAALIASIAIDHRDWFGDSREAIALEKAGILRSGKPAIIGDPQPPASLLNFAHKEGIAISRLGVEFGYQRRDDTWDWQGLGTGLEQLPFPALSGEHQLRNASAAIQLLRSVAQHRPVSEAAIRDGLQMVKLAGRFQYFEGPVPVLLDVAHNPEAAGILAGYLRERFPDRRIHAVFAVMRDKDIAGIIQPLAGLVEHWYLAPVAFARAATVPELKSVFDSLSVEPVSSGFATATEAIATARENAPPDSLLVVFGTFLLVSEFLAHNP
jgi:dihydrofolate synthase/folylpolyglutamate synthase